MYYHARGIWTTWSLRGVTFDMILKVSLLEQTINLLLELVTVFYVVSFKLIKLTPFSKLK